MDEKAQGRSIGRRNFLATVSLAAAGTAAAGAAALTEARAAEAEKAAEPLPTIQLGPHRVTRLVAGSNPINGYSYLGRHMDQHMREYFTVEQTVEFLSACERAGINTHQFSGGDKTVPVIRQLRQRGSKLLFFGLHSGRDGIKGVVESTQPIAIVHHGGVTDKLFSDGKSREVHDYVKEAHDRGVMAGVSAHNPDCIKRIADEGWEVDFFMTCFYFLTRPHEAQPAVAPPPQETLQIAYQFYRDDPRAMTAVVRQVPKPCFGFKILAAGRMCQSQQGVQEAFRFAFQNIKPSDGVIVGMYPRFFDEVRANAKYTRQFGKLS